MSLLEYVKTSDVFSSLDPQKQHAEVFHGERLNRKPDTDIGMENLGSDSRN